MNQGVSCLLQPPVGPPAIGPPHVRARFCGITRFAGSRVDRLRICPPEELQERETRRPYVPSVEFDGLLLLHNTFGKVVHVGTPPDDRYFRI